MLELTNTQVQLIRAILATKKGAFDRRLDYTAEGINTLLRGEALTPLKAGAPMSPLYIKAKCVLEVLGFTFPNDSEFHIAEQNYRLKDVLKACEISFNEVYLEKLVWTPKHWDKPDPES
ncbi:hypothetical protein L1D14_03785 [Vibrio tubiashii]|uniref:hypothetical protein n=1 Tax=Vibrio tubiashii TaxID=29498 RepID=UPI001EFE57B9|nr:hypothetical protein [Vibrio tubiashii]MCG9575351.1 hypothetical protein [Vibrio tubiashii]